MHTPDFCIDAPFPSYESRLKVERQKLKKSFHRNPALVFKALLIIIIPPFMPQWKFFMLMFLFFFLGSDHHHMQIPLKLLGYFVGAKDLLNEEAQIFPTKRNHLRFSFLDKHQRKMKRERNELFILITITIGCINAIFRWQCNASDISQTRTNWENKNTVLSNLNKKSSQNIPHISIHLCHIWPWVHLNCNHSHWIIYRLKQNKLYGKSMLANVSSKIALWTILTTRVIKFIPSLMRINQP